MRIPSWVYLFGGVAAGAILAVVATSIGPGRGAIDSPVAPARTSEVPVVVPAGSSSTIPGASGTVNVDAATTTVAVASTLAQVPGLDTEPVPPAPTVATTAAGTTAGPPSTPPGANAALTVPTTTTTTTTTTVPTTPAPATAAPTTAAPVASS